MKQVLGDSEAVKFLWVQHIDSSSEHCEESASPVILFDTENKVEVKVVRIFAVIN